MNRAPAAPAGAVPAPRAAPVAGAPPVDHAVRWQQAPCALVTTGDDGRVTDVNDTFVAWTGHRREDVVGAPFDRLLPVGDRILYSTFCVPQLALTGRVDEVAVQVVGAGGQRLATLLSATRAVVGAAAEVRVALFSAVERRRYEQDLLAARRRAELSEARRAEAEAGLQHLVLHDALTGLLNRSGLLVHLHDVLDDALDDPLDDAGSPARAPSATGGRAPTDVPALFFIDLDGFKTVNDSLGHAGGDALLVVAAERLSAAMRPGAVLARLAGDEFAVLDRVGPDDVGHLAQSLLDALAVPVVLHGVEVVVSASIGVALADGAGGGAEPPGGRDPAEDAAARGELLLRRADTAMYQAKGRGRAGWQLHDPDVGDATADRLLLLEQLRHALVRGEFRLHHQPRVVLATGQLDGVEALVRWQHPTRGLLPPSEFITVAEDSGLVRDLGAWVLEEAVAQAVRWDAAGGPDLRVAVNLSARQLADPQLPAVVAGCLVRHGLPARRLVLEITETALVSDPDAALVTLTALAALGTGLAVDDFGTGYSSLTYLKRFPVDELKIDRSFVAGTATDPGDRAIVAGCVHLAHALGLTAVAEGVETADQRDASLDLGCDLAQGYHYGRPVPPEDLLPWFGAPAPGTGSPPAP